MNNLMPPFNRIFCVGRNYRNHTLELNNNIPEKPVIFMKPNTCIVTNEIQTIKAIDKAELHYEAELVLFINQEGYFEANDHIDSFVQGFTLGLDLTLRQLQRKLKEKGLPWEKSKAFDHSSPLGKMIQLKSCQEIEELEFECFVNNERRQHGNVRDMIFSFQEILEEISKFWKLLPGDLIYTGTPEGVGMLHSGDHIRVESEQTGAFEWILV